MDDSLFVFQKGFNFSQDGPGNRLVYHLSGCNMICPWCSNPEGMKKEDYSQKYSLSEIFDEIISCKMMFFDNGGVTFTGGEVSLQATALSRLIKNLKDAGIHTCIETNASLKDTEKLIPLVDYMIADFKSPDKELLKAVTGGNLEIIKQNIIKRVELNKPLLIRIPLINNFNTGQKNAELFSEFFRTLYKKSESKEIYAEILTYHEFGKDKYKNLNLSYSFNDGFVSSEQVNLLKSELLKNDVKIIKT
ncbi:MAG: radical SAM protein [Clostridia bacterium]|nr:radical SAM protein [Clostridia bacterium]